MNVSRIAFVLVLGVSILPQPAFSQMMAPPVPMTASAFAGARPGQSIHIAVRVTGHKQSTIQADLLEPQTEKIYLTTGKHVELYLSSQTPIVMGGAEDLRPGAVVFVDGVATKPGHADAKRVVVLSQYVQVKER